jgi:hypothetical protein
MCNLKLLSTLPHTHAHSYTRPPQAACPPHACMDTQTLFHVQENTPSLCPGGHTQTKTHPRHLSHTYTPRPDRPPHIYTHMGVKSLNSLQVYYAQFHPVHEGKQKSALLYALAVWHFLSLTNACILMEFHYCKPHVVVHCRCERSSVHASGDGKSTPQSFSCTVLTCTGTTCVTGSPGMSTHRSPSAGLRCPSEISNFGSPAAQSTGQYRPVARGKAPSPTL